MKMNWKHLHLLPTPDRHKKPLQVTEEPLQHSSKVKENEQKLTERARVWTPAQVNLKKLLQLTEEQLPLSGKVECINLKLLH